MPPSPFAYSAYYTPPSHHFAPLPYPDNNLSLSHQDFAMSHHDQSMSHSMQPPPSPSIPIDPALALYPPYYPSYQQTPHHLPHHLSLPPNYSSPSSQGSDTIGTPPTEHMFPSSSSSNINGKRPASSISNSTLGDMRKKSRKGDESDAQSPTAEKEEVKAKPTRGSRACTVCRRLKMKCVGAEQGPPCKRCLAGNHECIFEESNRGKRSSKKHELLTRSLRKMERTLDTVLRSIGNPGIASGMVSRSPSPSAQTATTQALLAASPSPPPRTSSYQHPQPPGSPKLHSLPDNSLNPLGLLAEASLANRRAHATNPSAMVARPSDTNDNPKMGVASDNYFKPGPMTILPLRRLYIERQVQPEMLSFVGTDEVVELFNIYFDHMNMHCSLLDRDFHTPSLVCSRSPFLLTTICAISSKFYTAKPDLHPQLTELAKKLAFSVPAKGYKSVEIVQAYLLLALWGCGAVERYEQDKTWLLLGMAIRMATDLNLHRKTAVTSQDTQEGKARDHEVHNRERTWILCFCLDRSFSAQMGKPHSIKEDSIIRNAAQWHQSPAAIPSDASLAAYVGLQRILSRSLDILYSGTDTASGLQVNCDYLLIIKTFEAQIEAWKSELSWDQVNNIGESPVHFQYRKVISGFYYNYAMLVVNSFGLQNALERTPVNIGHFFARCHTSATACATLVRDELGPSGFLKYSPDSHCVQTSYAVLSLLKLIRPEFQSYLDNERQIFSLVKDVADTLEGIAANPLHTPALYSGFLRALISAKLDPATTANSTDSKPASQAASGRTSPSHVEMPPPAINGQSAHYGNDFLLNEFQFEGEMGPVADMSTFPPTMAPNPAEDTMGSLTMENILSSNFWDSVLVPGYNSMDGLSGGFVFGAGGSGLITPGIGVSPLPSGTNTPMRGTGPNSLTQMNINAAFDHQIQEGIKIDS
ncbi:fungal-specific transcription factor domain-containing protein [Infundibulicybe gibba]|nr:fungal-specific transcription factor domain-containing protein [Infundibulicybe gibba]